MFALIATQNLVVLVLAHCSFYEFHIFMSIQFLMISVYVKFKVDFLKFNRCWKILIEAEDVSFVTALEVRGRGTTVLDCAVR